MSKYLKISLFVLIASLICACATHDDTDLASRCEAGVNRFLNLYSGLQRHGGWAKMYHYPSFRPYASGERHMLLTKNDLDFGKSTGSAQKNMTLFLPAYEVLGDRRWLDATRNTADLLLKAKTSAGIWSSNYLMIEGKRPVPYLPFGDADVLGLEDDIQTHPIMMLIWLWRLTKDMHYRDTAIKGAELLIRAQNANGSWPQYWSLSDGKPRGHGHSVLNDGATTEPMFVLLMMYHATGDERWLAPIPQAVDWIISAQNRQGGIPGWAEQYDADNKPSWGREFEPPAVCPVPTNMAITGLDLAYRLTGNDKYLEPMRTLAGWLKENMRDEWGFYTDPKTAEPIHALNGKVYTGAQSPDIRAGEVVRPGNYYDAAKIEARIAELEQIALRPQLVNEKAVQQQQLTVLSSQCKRIEELLSSQKIDGAWQGTSKRTRSEQAVSFLDTTSCTTLINYLYTLAIVRGRLPSSNIFSTEFWFRAWPVADPYDTPLRRGPVSSFEFSPLSFASVLAGYNAPLLNPPQIVPPAPKALRIEAENAVLKSPLQIADAMGASDKKAVWSPSVLTGFSNAVSETAVLAEVSFKVERPGPHVFWMRVYFHSYGGASFWVRFDDDDWRVLEGGIRGEWQWLRMPSTPTLATGEHRLYFATREAGAVLDAMEISTYLDYVPEEQVGKEIVKPEELRESVPTEPVSVGEHTTYLATFDGAICDADFAKGNRHMGGVQFKLGQVGRFRSSVELKAKEVYLLCSGGPNIPGERGKLSLWFRPLPGSNPFVDGKQHYVFVLKYAPQVVRHVAEERYQIFENTVMLLIKGGTKTMQVYLNDGRRAQTYNVCKIPVDGLSPDTWHHLLFAWDYPARWVKLAVDGRGVKQNLPYRFDSSETLGLYLGNALYYNVLKPLGCYVDDLHISSQPD